MFIRFLATLAVAFYKVYTKTLRWQHDYPPELSKSPDSPFLYGFWHGRQFLLVPTFGKWNITLMVDISFAGSIQAVILEKFGYTVVRGSSKRKGVQALLDMKKCIDEGKSGAFALDGPSGPIYQSKPGMLFLARKLHLPIVLLISSASKAWVLKNTWCRYMIPKPFSRVITAMAKPIYDAEGVNEKDLDAMLVSLMQEMDERMGRPKDIP